MSYTRWSSVINPAISFKEEADLYCKGMSYSEVKDLKLSTEDSYLSEWYIYWHDNGLGTEEQTKENQLLAMWYSMDELPIFDYPEIKIAYENKNLEGLFKKPEELTQIDILYSCVGQFIKEVEEEFDGN